jgi:Leucine-rich repeat (LRR) protein
MLVLAGNDLQNDHLDFLGRCMNLIKLDLSHNHITRLPDKASLENLTRLEVACLHFNKLASLEAIRPIYKCSTLTFLTYHHNPLEVHVKHEHEMVNCLPNLKLINSRVIAVEERSEQLMHDRPQIFADADMLENWKSTENSEAYYLRVLNVQLQYIDNLWAYHNPIVVIQRAWQHFQPLFAQPSGTPSISSHSRSQASKHLERRSGTQPKRARMETSAHPLRSYFEEWRKFSDALRAVRTTMSRRKQSPGKYVDKSHMLLPL